jgi:transcriptional regulator with PAS, ATPase and Fis domain
MPLNPLEISPEAQQAKLRFGIIGNAAALIAAVERAIRVAPIDLSVLVTGESGSGKEFFPQIIHNFSARKHAKYIAVNCGAIPEGTIDSELFGHEKGAFTGAVGSRKGYFEEANGGTIFLDEVAELPLTTQARLLRVLESGEFLKVGSSTVQKTNIRIVAATNVDMLKAVADGRFREDLYYRLSTVQITIPPLRERGNDILLLTRKFASDFAEKYRMPPISFDKDATDILSHYRWPGNVRQLKNVIEQIALFDAGSQITRDVLRNYLPANATVTTPAIASDLNHDYEREREMIFSMLFRLQNRLEELSQHIENKPTERHALPPSRTVDQYVEVDEPAATSDTDITTLSLPTDNIRFSTPSNNDFLTHDDAGEPTSLEEREREIICQALERNSGRRKQTAQELGISERTLYRKIKEYGLE